MQVDHVELPAVSQVESPLAFYIYRGDLENRAAPGNKQHKMKYHLDTAHKQRCRVIATFGGPHSNHVDAFVNRAVEEGLLPIVVVRGEVHAQLTSTLRSAVAKGAVLFPSQRIDYKKGMESTVRHLVDQLYDEVYWVPEGGGGELGVLGCKDWADSIMSHVSDIDMVCVASGTGTTATGFLASDLVQHLAVFSALKGQDQTINKALLGQARTLLQFSESYHGGFGKMSDELVAFLKTTYQLNPHLVLDPIYTSKMLYHVNSLVLEGRWDYPRTLFIHSGGLQGWQGMPKHRCPYPDLSL